MKKRLFILAILILSGPFAGAQEGQRYSFVAPKMGTPFRLLLYAEDSLRAANAAQKAFDRVDELNRVMSDYDPDSEINRLADQAKEDPRAYYPVSPDLWQVLQLAQSVARRSGGAFDVTVGPLSRLWRRAFRRRTFPEQAAIAEARSLVNYRWLRLRKKDRSVRLKKAGMRLDLGGIAKGYAVDAAYAVLKREGFARSLVDGGGDIYAGEPPAGEKGWQISRKKLHEGELLDEIVYLHNQAIATSGDTYRFLEWEGRRYSHLIDPRTGLGTTGSRQVTITTGRCMTADALASALSVVELEKTRRIARRFDVSFRIIIQPEEGPQRQLGNAP